MVGCSILSMCFVLTSCLNNFWTMSLDIRKTSQTPTQIPVKATVRSRVGVLNSVLLAYCFRERGNTSKGCSDDPQLVTCLVTCPMAQGELHTQNISQASNVVSGSVGANQFGRNMMYIIHYNPMFTKNPLRKAASRFDCLPWIPLAPALKNDPQRWSASARARRAILSEL